MKRFLIATAMALAVTFAPAMVKADFITTTVWDYGPNGEDYAHWAVALYDDDGNLKSVHWYDILWEHVGSWYADSNPNPENDNQGGAIDRPDLKELAKLAKQEGKRFEVPPDFWTTKLGQELIKHGTGPVPAINPNPEDDDQGGDSGPKSPTTSGPGQGPLDPFGLNKEVKEELKGPGATFQFQPNAGSPGEQLQGMGGKKGSSGDPSTPDKKTSAAHGAFGDLPGPPELVNPSWGSKSTKAHKAKAKGKSSDGQLAKGLLPAVQSKTGYPPEPFKGKTGKATAKLGYPPEPTKSTKGLVKTKTALKCAPNTTPNAGGTACLPKLDMPGFDSSLGSSIGGAQGAAAGGAATRRR